MHRLHRRRSASRPRSVRPSPAAPRAPMHSARRETRLLSRAVKHFSQALATTSGARWPPRHRPPPASGLTLFFCDAFRRFLVLYYRIFSSPVPPFSSQASLHPTLASLVLSPSALLLLLFLPHRFLRAACSGCAFTLDFRRVTSCPVRLSSHLRGCAGRTGYRGALPEFPLRDERPSVRSSRARPLASPARCHTPDRLNPSYAFASRGRRGAAHRVGGLPAWCALRRV